MISLIIKRPISEIVENVVEVTSVSVDEIASILVWLQIMSATEHSIKQRWIWFVSQCGHSGRELITADTQLNLANARTSHK